MDAYPYLKFLHVVFASLWLGGGIAMIVLGLAAMRARDDQRLVQVVLQVVWLADRLFVPASLLTLVFGVAMAWMAWSFLDLWIVLGLAGFLATFVTGVFVIKPMTERVAAIVAAEGATAPAVALGRRILRTAVFDYTAIVLVVAVMVLKPAAGDVLLLGIMAATLLVAATVCLVPPRGAAASAG